MSGLLFDTRLIKVYEDLEFIAKNTGKSDDYISVLWAGLLADNELMDEFIYYIDNQTIKDDLKFEGYSLADMYVYSMSKYNLVADTGKNTAACSKDSLVLDAFMCMHRLKADPEKIKKIIDEGRGMDIL